MMLVLCYGMLIFAQKLTPIYMRVIELCKTINKRIGCQKENVPLDWFRIAE